MTVPNPNRRNDYVGTGGLDTYDYDFKIFAATELVVWTEDGAGNIALLAYPADYTVSGAGDPNGGSITLTAGNLANGVKLAIRMLLDLVQKTDVRNQGDFFPATHEDVFDRLTKFALQQQDELDRAIKLPETETGGAGMRLPAKSLRLGKYLGFDGTTGLPTPVSVLTVGTLSVSGFIETLLDDADATTALATLGLVVSAFAKTLLDDADVGAFLATLMAGSTKPAAAGAPINFGLKFTANSGGASALKAEIKSVNGASDPAASNPVFFPMPNDTGAVNWVKTTAATSFTISNGSTLGHESGVTGRIYWYALNAFGTIELAASSTFFGQHGVISTTAEGGAGGADSAIVMYSATARPNVAFLCLGYTEDSQTTAGAWLMNPRRVALAPFESSRTIIRHKTIDESLSSSTVLQDDDDLHFPIGANEDWVAEFNIWCGSSLSLTGLLLGMTIPAGAQMRFVPYFIPKAAVYSQSIELTTSGMSGGWGPAAMATLDAYVGGMLWVRNGANAGDVKLQWAQSTSSANVLKFFRGSHLTARRVA